MQVCLALAGFVGSEAVVTSAPLRPGRGLKLPARRPKSRAAAQTLPNRTFRNSILQELGFECLRRSMSEGGTRGVASAPIGQANRLISRTTLGKGPPFANRSNAWKFDSLRKERARSCSDLIPCTKSHFFRTGDRKDRSGLVTVLFSPVETAVGGGYISRCKHRTHTPPFHSSPMNKPFGRSRARRYPAHSRWGWNSACANCAKRRDGADRCALRDRSQ